MMPKHWSHTRRTAQPCTTDPLDTLMQESVSAAASGKVLQAMRLLRFADQLTKMRKKRRPPIILAAPSAPPPPTPRPVRPPPPAPQPATHWAPPPNVTDPLSFTPEEEARFAAIRAMRKTHASDGSS